MRRFLSQLVKAFWHGKEAPHSLAALYPIAWRDSLLKQIVLMAVVGCQGDIPTNRQTGYPNLVLSSCCGDSCVSIYDQSQSRPERKSYFRTAAVSPSRNSRNSGCRVANQPANELFNSLPGEKEEVIWQAAINHSGSHVLFSEQVVRHHALHVRFVGTIREPIFLLKCAKTWFFPIFGHIGWDMTWWWPQMCSKSIKNIFFISPRL